LSGHPFTAYRAEIGRFVRTNLRSLAASAEGEGGTRTQLIAGVVESVRVQRTQGGRMVVLTLSDGTATQEVTVYNEVFDQVRDLGKFARALQERPVSRRGVLPQRRRERGDAARRRLARHLGRCVD